MDTMISHFNRLIIGARADVIEGVRELLGELDKEGFLLGLVTGNLEPIAMGKLEAAGLRRYFKLADTGATTAAGLYW